MSEPQEPQVHGIAESDYQGWRHHPVSKVFLRYLADKRAFLERAALDQWIGGSLSLQADQTLRGQVIELFEIENMPFAAMAEFYSMQEENAAEAH